MRDALLLVDVINAFDHEDADVLLASFRQRLPGIVAAIADAHEREIPVIYVNDQGSDWSSDAPRLVRTAVEAGRGGDVIAKDRAARGRPLHPQAALLSFDHTPLALLLDELEVERLLLAGAATEGCVVQTGIDARELGLKVTILADACATVDQRLERIALEYAEQVAGIYVVVGGSGRG